MTRVAWCQNYEKKGGAEISSFNVIQVGSSLGFDIIGWRVGGENPGVEILKYADIVIVNNLHYVDDSKAELLDFLFKSGKPFIKYDHDCYENEKEIYRKSVLNVFISPMHAQHYFDFCGEEIKGKSRIFPLAFDVNSWNPDGPHTPGTVFIPSYGKCRDHAIDYMNANKNLKFYIATDVAPPGENVFKLGKIPHTKMAEYYPQYETVFHCPMEKAAGERILFEAVMCGCKVITNNMAGHVSWTFDWKDPKVLRPILKRAPYEFWRAVDEVMR